MIKLIRKIIKDHLLGLSLVSAGLIFYAWFLAGFFPALMKTDIQKIVSQYPESLKAFFGGSFDISTFESFLNVEYFSLMWVIIVAGYLIAFITSEISKEIETASIEALLSLPLSRIKIIFVKWVSVLLVTIFLVAVTIISVIVLASAYDIDYSLKGIWLMGLLGFLFVFAIATFTMALAVYFNERNKAVFIPIVVLIFSYVWNSVGQLIDSIKDWRFISLFYYYDSMKALVDKEITTASILVFSAIIIASTAFIFYWFKRRDFAV